MGKETRIGWCDSTFNAWIGCQKVSPGCANCFAKTLMDDRFHRVTWGPAPEGTRRRTSPKNWTDVVVWNAEALASGRPWKVFCGSLLDWLEDRADLVDMRRGLLALIEQTPSLTWLMLSKRLHLAPRLVRDVAGIEISEWLVRNPHVWMGTSIENQRWANERMQWLVSLSAAVRFLSIEPMLGPIDLRQVRLPDGDTLGRNLFSQATGYGVDWVIVGAESGKGARPMQEDWVRNLRDQCVEAGVPFFYKQQVVNGEVVHAPELDGRQWQEFPVAP